MSCAQLFDQRKDAGGGVGDVMLRSMEGAVVSCVHVVTVKGTAV